MLSLFEMEFESFSLFH